jgi:predicted AlkP superfamily phosphohydrolase/phosphomutase
MVNRSPALILFAIDAADAGFVTALTSEGHLPTIASIMRKGRHGRIGGPELVSSLGNWLSFFSGISKSEHGYYDHRQLQPGTYDLCSVTPKDFPALPFWSRLNGGSKKSAIIDAPEAFALPSLPGVQVGSWGTQQAGSLRLPASGEPAGVLREVRRLVGEPIEISAYEPGASFEEDLDAYHLLLKRIEHKGELCCHFLRQDRHDLVVVAFSEAHTAAHRFWDYRPEAARGRDHDELRNAMRDVHQAIDRQMSLVLKELPEDANVFIVSLSGMKDLYPTTGLIHSFCRRLGYQATSSGVPRISSPLDSVRRLVSPYWRSRVSRLLPPRMRDSLESDKFKGETNWGKTRAFALPSLNTSYVRVNLRGREPQGIVEPGRDYEHLLDEIDTDLKALIDVKPGAPAVEKVTRTTAAFHCDPPRVLPDLFIEWKAAAHVIERLAHPKCEITQPAPWYDRSSYHLFSGFFAAAGPAIGAASDIGEFDVLAFVPTFLQLLNEPLPPGMSGRPIQSIIGG